MGRSLRSRLRAGEALLGTFVKSADPAIAETLASSGLDFLLADLEHSSLAIRDVENIARAGAVWNVPVVVRMAANRLAEAGRALEAGAAGIQVSDVSALETLEEIGRATSFPPAGRLGLSLAHRGAAFGATSATEYIRRLTDDVVVIAQIESRAGLDSLPQLLTTSSSPDAWFLGPMDLSCDLGRPGDLAHPDVRTALDGAASTILTAEQRLGVFARDDHDAAVWRARGATFVALGSDLALLAARAREIAASWRAASSANHAKEPA